MGCIYKGMTKYAAKLNNKKTAKSAVATGTKMGKNAKNKK